ncbi:MAG: NAD(P)H-binding protein [Burkholderiales bacterium]|jgi:uncharacterized protein YbjT (DUF2867 family)
MSRIIAVAGSTGTVGRPLVARLAAAGATVRALTRRPDDRPAPAGAQWVDAASPSAFDGAHAAFLLSPPGLADQEAVLAPMIESARAAGVRKVVLMTAMGVDADESLPFRRAERRLEASGLDWAVLRPNWFDQNFASFWLHDIAATGSIRVPAGPAATSFVDARDIADCAAVLLSRDGTDGAFVLTGPRALTYTQAAAVLSEAAGRPIGYVDADPAAFEAGLRAAGLPADYAGLLGALFGVVRAGHAAGVTDDVRRITSRAPRSLETYAADHRAVWAAA